MGCTGHAARQVEQGGSLGGRCSEAVDHEGDRDGTVASEAQCYRLLGAGDIGAYSEVGHTRCGVYFVVCRFYGFIIES